MTGLFKTNLEVATFSSTFHLATPPVTFTATDRDDLRITSPSPTLSSIQPEQYHSIILNLTRTTPIDCPQFNLNNTSPLFSNQTEQHYPIDLDSIATMATKTPTAQSLFTFEPSDVRLKVNYKGEAIIAHVSSSAMSFASPVWKKFIFPPWKPVAAKSPATDSDPTPDPKKSKIADSNMKDKEKSGLLVEELDFTDDNGEALLILLRIAHLRFQDNPTNLPYQTLLQVAVLVDQYQCINLVRPWLSQWLADEETSSLTSGHENWLFIAWVFGRERVFKELAAKMILGVIVNPITKSVYMTSLTQGGKYKVPEPMPNGIMGRIAEVRHEVILQLLAVAHARIDKCLQSKESLCRSDSYNARSEDCDTIVLGSFMRSLQELGVLPRAGPTKIHMKVQSGVGQ